MLVAFAGLCSSWPQEALVGQQLPTDELRLGLLLGLLLILREDWAIEMFKLTERWSMCVHYRDHLDVL